MACVQNLPQLVSLYGPHSPLLASVHTQVHYSPLDRQTSEYVEAMLGPSTVIAQSWGETQGASQSASTSGWSSGRSRSTSASQQEVGRPLLTAAEIRGLGSSTALVLTAGCAPILARKLGVPQPSLPTRAWGTAMAHREACATVAGALLVLAALIPALAPVTQAPPVPQPQPVVAQPSVGPPSAPPAAPSTRQAMATTAAAVPVWRLYMREPWHPTGHKSRTLAPDFPNRETCMRALLEQAEGALRLLHHPSNQKVYDYTLDVDNSQPDRLTWTVHYRGKIKMGGLPLNPGNAPDIHERWCVEEEK
jgi:hypothetical protein